MRGLKTLVIGMAVLIAAGMIVLVFAVVNRAGNLSGETAAFEASTIDLPAGASVRETRIDGDRIVVRVELPDGASRLLIIDARTGRAQGTVDLKATP